jgi:hypothetical protein
VTKSKKVQKKRKNPPSRVQLIFGRFIEKTSKISMILDT